ncbi:MAG: ABC transporter permease [Actinobacteria bacterium]|nr:ABC transporter permease [Actinomycetota bacterium]
MTRFLLKRLGLALVTLVLLSVIVFAVSSVLPGNVGRAVLGPFATQESVDALNEQLGTDRPVVTQYVDWAGRLLRGDLGTSLSKQVPAWDLLGPALVRSLKLAAIAFLICVPISILGGIVAGLRYGRPADKAITIAGLSLAAMPEFVSGIVLILVFSIWLRWLPVTAQWDEGAGFLTQVEHLVLPGLTLTLVLFGYIARITRAGMVEALDSDYARTAFLKGLPPSLVIRRHVLRNALLPTIAVVAVQIGYLVGGLVVVEVLFNYQGVGSLIYEAARQKDLPLLTAGVLVVGVTYLLVTLVADVLYALLNPRIRLAGAE